MDQGLGNSKYFYLRGDDFPGDGDNAYSLAHLGKKLKGTNSDKV